MARFFNTAMPCRPDWHFMVPAVERLGDVVRLIEQRAYFVVHAPRQTGKTTSPRALARELTAEGRYAGLHFSCEAAEAAGEDFAVAEKAVVRSILNAARADLPVGLQPPEPAEVEAGQALATWLAELASGRAITMLRA